MRNQVFALLPEVRSWSCCFQVETHSPAPGLDPISSFEVDFSDLLWWRLPVSTRISRGVRSENVRQITPSSLSDPIALFLLIASHAMTARALLYHMREPAFWVRRMDKEDWAPRHRPALPETQISELLEVPTRQISPALTPLLEDGALELVRSPSGVRAILMRDDFIDEARFRARLRA